MDRDTPFPEEEAGGEEENTEEERGGEEEGGGGRRRRRNRNLFLRFFPGKFPSCVALIKIIHIHCTCMKLLPFTPAFVAFF